MKVGVDDLDRAQILDLSDGLRPGLATPPSASAGVCARCSTWTRGSEVVAEESRRDERGQGGAGQGEPMDSDGDVDESGVTSPAIWCENCAEVRDALDREPLALSVISLYRKPSPLRDVLTRYKGRGDEEDPFDSNCVPVVRSMLGRYLLEHGDRLVELSGGIDGIVVVPSTDRPPPHPLEQVVDSLDLNLPRWPMLARGSGELGFRKPSKEGYRMVVDREPSRILLVDDVYTTGSRLNSAASILDRGGHRTVAALVLARRINPDFAPEALALWTTATNDDFDWQASPLTVAS
ncbi:MAG: hypothetical protein Q7T73_03495 [Beijerinckiaceae bacterium]|nr:hypothetical protein [Beijerinckiaceae bacterium]